MNGNIRQWQRTDRATRPTEVMLDASFILTLYSLEANKERDQCRKFYNEELKGKVTIYVSEWVVNEALHKTEKAFEKIAQARPDHQGTAKAQMIGQLMHFFDQRTRPLVPSAAQACNIRRMAAQLRSIHAPRLGVTDTYIIATGIVMQKTNMVGSDWKWGRVDTVRFWKMPRVDFVVDN